MAAVAILYLPGAALLIGSRARPLYLPGYAPLATCGVFSLLAYVFHAFAIPWNLFTACVGSACLVLLIVLFSFSSRVRALFRLRDGEETPPLRPISSGITTIGVTLAMLVVAVPVYRFSKGFSQLNNSYDSLFHYNATEMVRRVSDATPWTALRGMFDGIEVFYPVTFHQIAAIIPAPTVLSVNVLVMVLLFGSACSLASLMWGILPGHVPERRRAIAIACVLPSLFIFFSLPTMALTVGLWPNILGEAQFPALLGISLLTMKQLQSLWSEGILWRPSTAVKLLPLTVALITGGLIHPSLIFSFGVMAFSAWCAIAYGARRTRPNLAYAALALALCVALAYDYIGATLLRQMALTVKTYVQPRDVLLTILADRPRLGIIPLKTQYVMPVVLLAVAGVWRALRSKTWEARTLLIYTLACFTISLGTVIPFLPISSLANPWYQARERVIPMFSLGLLLLALVGLLWLWEKLIRKTRGSVRVILLTVILVGLLLPPLLTTVVSNRMPALAKVSLQRGDYLGQYVSDAERAFIEDAGEKLPEDAVVIGLPADGTPMFYALAGKNPVFLHAGYPSSTRQLLLSRRLNDIFIDSEVCRAARSYGGPVYLYRDRSPQRGSNLLKDINREVFSGVEHYRVDGERRLTEVATSPNGYYSLYLMDIPCLATTESGN
ncbi:DUF6541 family protein [Dermabacteraceae bacterium P7006]